jgi:hypothetical protein
MLKFVPGAALACVALSCVLLTSCGSSNPTHVVPPGIPTSISLTPSPNISLESGKSQLLTATARNSVGTAISQTFSYQTNNASVATVANNGNLCAGTWDSLTTPTICTAGATGTTQIVAVAQGVTSPPVTVYVHQHITNITVSKVPNQPPTLSTLCLSKRAPSGNPESTLYQAFAFNGNTDITASVGPFSWQTVSVAGQTPAVSLSSLPSGSSQCLSGQQGACLNQEVATAGTPGLGSFFASAGGVNSSPLQFTTCPVQSISVTALGSSATSFLVNTNSSTTLNATVTDSLGMTLTDVPLTWSSSDPVVVHATGATSTVFGSVGTAGASGAGAAAVTASCTPPSCNGGFAPSMPIYPTQAISFTVEQASGAPAAPTVYVTSTGCSSTTQSCTTRIVPISRAGSTTSFSPQNPITLPFPPNSVSFTEQGTSAYLGTNTLAFGTQSAMLLNGSTASQIPNVAGNILATSPDGTTAIFSDTTDSPNRVFICQNCSGTTSQNVSTFLMNDASAAAFSPDSITGGYKAYVVSRQPCPDMAQPGCLLVFSKLDSAKFVPLSAPATDVTFIGNGTLGYIAGGDPAGAAFLPTCDDPGVAGAVGGVSLPSQQIRALPDGQSALALNAPNIQSVTATISGSGCPPPRGPLAITNNPGPSASLGVSSFTPTQFFLSPDGTIAYILGQIGSGANVARLPFILAFNTTSQTTADISLAGNATPLSASVSPAGDFLFVGADDGAVHVIDTVTQLDTQQVPLPFPQSSLCIGPGNPATQVETTMTVTAASQSGSSTAYTYTSLTGPALQVGETIVVTGLTSPTDNGIFTIASLGSGTFTVVNTNGVTTSGQNGIANSGVICNPDLVAVKP